MNLRDEATCSSQPGTHPPPKPAALFHRTTGHRRQPAARHFDRAVIYIYAAYRRGTAQELADKESIRLQIMRVCGQGLYSLSEAHLVSQPSTLYKQPLSQGCRRTAAAPHNHALRSSYDKR